MTQVIRADSTKTFEQVATELEEAVPALRPVPSDVPPMPGLDPPTQAVYALTGEEGVWMQVEVPDSLSPYDLEVIFQTLKGLRPIDESRRLSG